MFVGLLAAAASTLDTIRRACSSADEPKCCSGAVKCCVLCRSVPIAQEGAAVTLLLITYAGLPTDAPNVFRAASVCIQYSAWRCPLARQLLTVNLSYQH